MDKDSQLGILASAILDGTPVDWNAADSTAEASERGVIRNCKSSLRSRPFTASRTRTQRLSESRTGRLERFRQRQPGGTCDCSKRSAAAPSARCIGHGIRTSIARSRSSCSARPPLLTIRPPR